MTGLEAIASLEATAPRSDIASAAPRTAVLAPEVNFSELMAQGYEGVEQRIDNANRLVRAFALDDSVPLHEVTIALEEARLAVELASTIRARLVESFREIMNTQL